MFFHLQTGEQKLTLTAIPPEAPSYISCLNRPFLTGLKQNKEPLQLVGDTGDGILLRFLKLPTKVEQMWKVLSFMSR